MAVKGPAHRQIAMACMHDTACCHGNAARNGVSAAMKRGRSALHCDSTLCLRRSSTRTRARRIAGRAAVCKSGGGCLAGGLTGTDMGGPVRKPCHAKCYPDEFSALYDSALRSVWIIGCAAAAACRLRLRRPPGPRVQRLDRRGRRGRRGRGARLERLLISSIAPFPCAYHHQLWLQTQRKTCWISQCP